MCIANSVVIFILELVQAVTIEFYAVSVAKEADTGFDLGPIPYDVSFNKNQGIATNSCF